MSDLDNRLFDLFGQEAELPPSVQARIERSCDELRASAGEREKPMKTRKLKTITRTILIAAVIAAFLSVTAYAAGLSINRRRQEEIRQEIGASESAPAYVEYQVPEEDTPGATLLSAVNDGTMQQVYLNIGPVDERDLMFEALHPFDYSVNGGAPQPAHIVIGNFTPEELNPDGTVSDEALIRKFREAYDEESGTIPILCSFLVNEFSPGDTVTLSVSSIHRDYGSVDIAITEPYTRKFSFPDPIELRFPDSGRSLRVVGAELSASRLVLGLEIEDGTALTDAAALTDWTNFIEDQVVRRTALHFADGGSCTFAGFNSFDLRDGVIWPNCELTRSVINPMDVASITIGDVTIEIE